jgi:hypothetical protein
MKNDYQKPELVPYGTVETLTAAIGNSASADQSDYPQQFPPDGGCFDVCDNNNPNTMC